MSASPSSLPIQSGISLRQCNTFGIDASARAYLRVDGPDVLQQLRQLRQDARLMAMPRLVLGGGSNILLTGDVDGLVLHMANRGIDVVGEDDQATYVRAAAGESWDGFVQETLRRGLGGLENLSLIPGSVGASPIQNIGAYGIEVKDTFHSLTAFDLLTGDLLVLDKPACGFGYRDSVFKHALRDRAVIVDVTFALPKRWQANTRYADVAQELASRGIDAPAPRDIADAVIGIRTRKLPDPAKIGNAGSFFKNPVVPAERRNALLESHPALVSHVQPDGSYKLAAGWLIDQCGWKGKTLGAAGVYEKQALVLVNRGGATGKDIADLAAAIQRDVMVKFGVMLEPEPVFV
ncbi:UDP-N-acetylmuramate dehydrogenase [Noviherbaspirillum galbum]|uniref:UDP-N-acetylenolpyruvoylglucosamine reductase n=1 Tax=Noviherbaspirillum galbum TaxID=2709383 RepID=A0A6B3SMT8_9BURK|nr:UDP-N-acetylmuramate dehydrogenase [Noviherbaspirillum galbum]NEX62031.1 UDP-N-acetylmuramate dehydrogenase [Noviherbaspirillum galbum]